MFGDDNEIVMENHNKYTKVCQVQYPRDSGEWCPDNSVPAVKTPTNLVHKGHKGQTRWTDLPKAVEVSFFILEIFTDFLVLNIMKSLFILFRNMRFHNI